MKTEVVAILLGMFAMSKAQVAKYCAPDPSTLCYKVNVPESSAKSGSGDIYLQLTGPDSLQWMALGQGQQMKGSNMFVVYADSSGTNVTLSPRLGTGHVMPKHDDGAQVTLLEGSGISDGVMTANVRCANCETWDGGSMQLTSTSSNWIWAMKQGDSLSTDSNSASIVQHDNMGSFTFDLGTARGGNSSNPFVQSDAASATPSSTSGSGDVGSSSSSSGSSSSGQGGTGNLPKYLKSHGIVMGIAFAVLFPIGVIVRAFTSSSIWVHAGVQALAYILAWVGLGLGVYIAKKMDYLDNYHVIIGLVVVSTIILQPILGLLQHANFKKNGTSGILGSVHRYLGLALILLGIVNGGLGLKVADNSKGGEIAYGVVAGVLGLAMLAGFVTSTSKRMKGSVAHNKEARRQHTNGSTST